MSFSLTQGKRKEMLKNKVFNIGIAVLLVIMAGCTAKQSMKGLVPDSKAAPEREAEIRKILDSAKFDTADQWNDYTLKIRPQVVKMGKDATPFVIEKIIEILEAGPVQKGMTKSYRGPDVLMYTLGDIKDSRALPILEYWVSEEKWRILRGNVAEALGDIGDPQAVDILWKVWNKEIGYLGKGDTRGPGASFGYHFTSGQVYAELAIIGQSLYQLGEKKAVGELIQLIKEHPETVTSTSARDTIGYFYIDSALRKIIGVSGLGKPKGYWLEWWEENKHEYR